MPKYLIKTKSFYDVIEADFYVENKSAVQTVEFFQTEKPVGVVNIQEIEYFKMMNQEEEDTNPFWLKKKKK